MAEASNNRYLANCGACSSLGRSAGRPSALHNVASGAILGYIGVSRGVLGIPLVDSYFFYRNPRISPPIVGGAVYGGIAFLFAAALGGKPL